MEVDVPGCKQVAFRLQGNVVTVKDRGAGTSTQLVLAVEAEDKLVLREMT